MRVLLALVFIVGSSLAAESAQKNPEQKPANTQQVTTVDQRGTEQLPAVVKILPTPKTVEEVEADRKDRAEKAYSDWALVKLTGALVIVGALQLLVFGYQALKLRETVQAAALQSEDMKASIAAAQASAKAAQKAADVAEASLIIAERPYLIHHEPKLKIFRFGHPGNPPSEPPEWCVILEYGLTNSGRSIALIKEITAELSFVKELPDLPKYSDYGVRVMAGNYPVEVGKSYACPTYRTKDTIDPATFAGLTKGDLKGFFFGYVRYADIFGYLHTEGFCFRFLKIGDGANIQSTCAMIGGPAYNYSRSEKIPPEGIESIHTQGTELTFEDMARLNSLAKKA